jgi:Tfp pilus assembly protein PilX
MSTYQQGVVLIIALILLIVISLLAATSMRTAASSEQVSSNVRTTELANQAAEVALRHCEASAIKVVKVLGGDTTSAEATYSTTLTQSNILWATTATEWQNVATTWDVGSNTKIFVVPSSVLGTATYKRSPECMVESLTGVTPVSAAAAFLVTARGFGPEVAAGTGRPQGTEIWLQSTIEIE